MNHIEQLKYITLIRLSAILAQTGVILIVHYLILIPLPLFKLLLINFLLIANNFIVFIIYTYYLKMINQQAIFYQLIVDIAGLSAILYLTGGSSNPFTSLFILQIVIASTMLSKRYLWFLVIITIICYTILMNYFMPIAYLWHYHLNNYLQMQIYANWFNFIFITILIAYFVVEISDSLNEQTILLTKAKEKILKDEQIITLGTLAAGVAHELATPLFITNLVIDQLLDNKQPLDHYLQQQLLIIANQIDSCNNSLKNLSADNYNVDYLKINKLITIRDYFTTLTNKWRSSYSNIIIKLTFINNNQQQIIFNKLLAQAFDSLLVNALQAALSTVEITIINNNMELEVNIFDDGSGIDKSIQNQLGNAYFTTKKNGHGLGLFLTESIINKLHGVFKLKNRFNHQGAHAYILIPINRLR